MKTSTFISLLMKHDAFKAHDAKCWFQSLPNEITKNVIDQYQYCINFQHLWLA
jgi:hypothetical protein